MIITKKFIMDMGVCGESLTWYEGIFGLEPHPYFTVYNKVKHTQDIDEETRGRWIKWCDSLQTNAAAIMYDGRYEYSRYSASGLGIYEIFPTEAEAIAALEAAKNAYYNTEISNTNNLFRFSQVKITDDVEYFEVLNSPLDLKEGYLYSVHCQHDSLSEVVTPENIQSYLENKILECKEEDKSCWFISRELRDTDDGFSIWERVH